MNKDSIKFAGWQAEEIRNGMLALMATARLAFEDARRSKAARAVGAFILAALALTLWTLVTFRVAQRNEERKFDEWRERYVNDYVTQREAEERGMPIDPKAAQREWDIDETAKVLYGVKGNSETDLRTYCWAGFNRVDIKTGEFKDVHSLSEVYAKPWQFMGYTSDNPVLGSLRKIAEEEYNIWQSGKDRPCDVDKVFIYWTPDKVMLLSEIGDMVNTWRYGE